MPSKRVGRASASPSIAPRRLDQPSLTIDTLTTSAATASAHHSPRPIPNTPTIVARPVFQSARFMAASA